MENWLKTGHKTTNFNSFCFPQNFRPSCRWPTAKPQVKITKTWTSASVPCVVVQGGFWMFVHHLYFKCYTVSKFCEWFQVSMYLQKCWIIYLTLKLIPCLCHTCSFVIVVFSICQNLHNFILNLQKNEEKNKTRQLNYDPWQKTQN